MGQGLQGGRLRGPNVSLAETWLRVRPGHRRGLAGPDHAGHGPSNAGSLGQIYAQQRERPASVVGRVFS